MAHFYGVLQGARGQATRLGHKGSGLSTTAASWQGAVRVELFVKDGVDWAVVGLTTWQGAGITKVLYDGPVSGAPVEGKIALPGGHK